MHAKQTLASVTRMPNPEGRVESLRLDKNEHTYGLPQEFVTEVLKGLTPAFLASYPEVRPLYAKLASTYGVTERNLMLTAGSDPGIKAFYEVFVSEGSEVVLPSPTYAMFPVYAKIFGANVVAIPYDRDLVLDPEAFLDAIHPGVSMVAIANPNSPTGTVIEQAALLRIIAKAHEASVPILLDEAYYPFWRETVLPHINDYENLAVTRTFSKAFGIANLRLGFMAAHETMIELLMKVRPMYEINGVAAYFGCQLLDHMDLVDAYVLDVDEGKQYLASEMEAMGFEPFPTHANFMAVAVPDPELRRGLVSHLGALGTLIAGGMAPPLDECIGLTLGPKEQMAVVVGQMREYLESST